MVDVKITEEGAETTFNGSAIRVVKDCCIAVAAMYKALSSLDDVGPLAARVFKEAIVREHSPAWDEKMPDHAVVVQASGLRKEKKEEETHGEE